MIALRRRGTSGTDLEECVGVFSKGVVSCTILYSELVTRRHFIIVPAPNGASRRQKLYDRFSIRRKEVRRDL